MSYTQAPPGYSGPKGYSAVPQSDAPSASASASASAATPLLPHAADAGPRQEGDVDADDFKFGVSVEQSAPEVRQMFLKKVYSILFLQILGTALVGSTMRIPSVSAWVMANSWVVVASSISALVSMGILYFKRHSHPTNLVLLGLFTTLEAVSLGSAVAYVNQVVVLQALILTIFVFAGLTLFVWIYPEINYAKLGPWLFGALLLLVGAGFVQLFVPFSNALDMAFAGVGVVVFSGYILFDTHMIMKRMSAEEWVLAVISLYLDIINLFLSILRILNGVQDD